MVVDKRFFQQFNTLCKYFAIPLYIIKFSCTMYMGFSLNELLRNFYVIVSFSIGGKKYRISWQNLRSSGLKRNVIVNISYMIPYYKGYITTLTQSLSDFGFDNDIEISHKVVLHSRVSSIAYRSLRTWMPLLVLWEHTFLLYLSCFALLLQ